MKIETHVWAENVLILRLWAEGRDDAQVYDDTDTQALIDLQQKLNEFTDLQSQPIEINGRQGLSIMLKTKQLKEKNKND